VGAGGGLAWPWSDTEPVLALARHGGIGDSFTLVWLLAGRYGRRPRIVLKDILLWEPLIDVALTRMGACFLPPAGRREQALETRVAAIAADLRPGDALLLFPEGGNWTPRRRHAAMARLWAARKPQAARQAALFEHVLPPRAGGVLACLDVIPDIPVVVMAHTGLDKVTTAGELWGALPFQAEMSIRWWPAAPAPATEDDRLAWLTREWAVVDQWIDAHHPTATL
jgi:1-acyl-sn-glycerol-3-phosphate acyltransferase